MVFKQLQCLPTNSPIYKTAKKKPQIHKTRKTNKEIQFEKTRCTEKKAFLSKTFVRNVFSLYETRPDGVVCCVRLLK